VRSHLKRFFIAKNIEFLLDFLQEKQFIEIFCFVFMILEKFKSISKNSNQFRKIPIIFEKFEPFSKNLNQFRKIRIQLLWRRDGFPYFSTNLK